MASVLVHSDGPVAGERGPPKWRRGLSAFLRMAFFPVALLLPAGTWRWWEAWALFALYVGYALSMTVYLTRHDPALLAERLKGRPVQQGQLGWDKVVMSALFVAGLGVIVVPGLDVVRFGWSEPLPLWARLFGLALHLPCFVLIGWVMRENTFLSRVVKIDAARGHSVITTGPYALVRHPMYLAVLVMIAAMPLALGSRYGLLCAAVMAVLLVLRTALEDRSLHRELAGYPEYARQTRFRLIPGLW